MEETEIIEGEVVEVQVRFRRALCLVTGWEGQNDWPTRRALLTPNQLTTYKPWQNRKIGHKQVDTPAGGGEKTGRITLCTTEMETVYDLGACFFVRAWLCFRVCICCVPRVLLLADETDPAPVFNHRHTPHQAPR